MKYKYNLKNLDCANCARKIEEELNHDKEIKNASVNFSNLKLTFETDYDKDVLKYIRKIISKVEPDVLVYDIVEKKDSTSYDIIRLLLGISLGLFGLYIENDILLLIAYIILIFKVLIKAFKILINDKSIDENLLISISIIGAYLIGKHIEGLMVIVLYEIGKILEAKALNNSRKSIKELMDIKPKYANIMIDGNVKKVNPNSVKINDIIIIKEGEKIPLDGVIVEGSASLNTSALTGESKLKNVKKDDEVLSGMIVMDGLIQVCVNKLYEDSTVNKILELVENATNTKAKTETFVAKVSKIYTPIVIILSIFTFLYGIIFTSDNFDVWLYKSLVFLVISCPCAIAISVPLSYFAGIGKCSKNGILVKGSNYLDNLKNIKRIVFDKTGTLTSGSFKDIKIDIKDSKYTEDDIKKIIVKGESFSNHPIAKSLINLINIDVNFSDVKNYEEHKGMGISFEIGNDRIKIGNNKFCKSEDLNYYIYVCINNKLVAGIHIKDKIKDKAITAIDKLKRKKIICEMFTGDTKNEAIETAKILGIDNVKYELLPQDKCDLLKKLVNKNDEVIAFVGDGINDAPVLAISHIGISMGALGSEAAVEASDVVIMTDDLEKINEAIDISKYTSKIIKQNLVFALGVKALVLILSVFGLANMYEAVFADVGVTLITILNSMRILKFK